MSGFHPRDSIESALWGVEVATLRAEEAELAAERAAAAAARQERLAALGTRAADVHARMANVHRTSEQRQRAAARLQNDYAWMMADWVARRDPDSLTRPVLMNAVAHAVGWRDALLSVRDHTGAEQLVAASDDTARRAHELEVILGQGPSWEASDGGSPQAAGTALEARWPLYGSAVAQLDVHAVAAVPLRLGADLVGALTVTAADDVHRSSPRLADVASALRQCLLSAPELLRSSETDVPGLGQFEEADVQPELHQAAGVLWERSGLPIDDALALIRAHAYAEDRPVAEIAAEVIERGVLDA